MALITAIQKYSIHDGDGIRTTVFFKGCPLHCAWCHNPETQSFQKELMDNPEKCTGCMACKEACPAGAVSLTEALHPDEAAAAGSTEPLHPDEEAADIPDAGGKDMHAPQKHPVAVTDRKKCIRCGRCTEVCMQNIREIAGEERTPAQLLKECMKDRMFYEKSGGGVTFSGGEVLSGDQADVRRTAYLLHREGISLYIDTCGDVPWENIEKILPFTDVFLYDMKTADPEKHKQFTGRDNLRILENLEKLSRKGSRIYLRIPVVEGVNADEEEMREMVRLLRERNITPEKVYLLPYHNTGQAKYERLGVSYPGMLFRKPDPEKLESLRRIFRAAGFVTE